MPTRRAALRDRRRVEFGDWQTPDALAEQVLELLGRDAVAPQSVLEPTCGAGAFLAAASKQFPAAALIGYDVSPAHVEAATQRLPQGRGQIQLRDFFTVDWVQVLQGLAEPLLIIGNPPWITNAALGALAGTNLPPKANFKAQSGFEALTGKSNFDVSEWMLIRLLQAARGRQFTLAMLCKASVARRVMEFSASQGWQLSGTVRGIDARRHFAAEVDAVLLQLTHPQNLVSTTALDSELRWPVYPSLAASQPTRLMGMVAGRVCSDVTAYLETRGLAGESELQWRSGLKHDCSSVMELQLRDGQWTNPLRQPVEVEAEFLYPLLKGSDVANGRMEPRRRVIVTQRQLGEDTLKLQTQAPKLWRYLSAHREQLDRRKSKIYAAQPPFAVFGVGAYAFAPFKVAICGLYKRLAFRVVEPFTERPVMLDDTAYFLPCASRAQAEELAAALSSPRASAFFQARVFWDAKRPINKALLQAISLERLLQTHLCRAATDT